MTWRELLNPDGTINHEKLDMAANETWLEIRRECIPQVDALIDAGWRFELVGPDPEPWQWAWRRPPRKKGKGMRFASTQQAFNALQKEKLATNL